MDCLNNCLVDGEEFGALSVSVLTIALIIAFALWMVRLDKKDKKDMVYEVTYQDVGFMGNVYTVGVLPISIPYHVYIQGEEYSIKWTLEQHDWFIEKYYRSKPKPNGKAVVIHIFKLIEG